MLLANTRSTAAAVEQVVGPQPDASAGPAVTDYVYYRSGDMTWYDHAQQVLPHG